MSPLPVTYTAAEIAAVLHHEQRWLLDRARLDPAHFPSWKVGRRVVFTDAHVQVIISHLERKPAPEVAAAVAQETDGWGRPALAVLREQRRRA